MHLTPAGQRSDAGSPRSFLKVSASHTRQTKGMAVGPGGGPRRGGLREVERGVAGFLTCAHPRWRFPRFYKPLAWNRGNVEAVAGGAHGDAGDCSVPVARQRG